MEINDFDLKSILKNLHVEKSNLSSMHAFMTYFPLTAREMNSCTAICA